MTPTRRLRPVPPTGPDEGVAVIMQALDGVPPEDALRLHEISRRRAFKPGTVIFHEGDSGDCLHLILRGRVAVLVAAAGGHELTYSIMGPGDLFGELALILPSGRRTATAQALEQVETLGIGGAEFERLRALHPAMNDILVSILARHVHRLSDRLREALYTPVDRRVRRRLLELAEIYGEGEECAVIPLRQDDIAGLAGADRATVNRVLRQEQAMKTLSLGHRRITILDLGAIRRRAGDEES
jgi:CRP/FNR family transcriptional regulator, cyclic AMP receptor protein